MKSKHILDILDNSQFADLGPEELALIETHSADCAECRLAYASARVSSTMFSARAVENARLEPTPFFQAKVMNAIREKGSIRKQAAAFRRWWQASYAMVSGMLVIVFVLMGLVIFAPNSGETTETQAVVPSNLFPTDAVILNQRNSRDLTTEQVFQVIYTSRYESSKK